MSNACKRYRQELTEMFNREIKVSHPICYDAYDLCEQHNNTFQEFNVALLKTICNHFEIPVKSRDRKKILIEKLSHMISECKCVCMYQRNVNDQRM